MPSSARRSSAHAAEAEADPEAFARAIVLRRLTASAQTRHQLQQALDKRDVSREVAARVLDRMTDVGLIDDAAYAHEYVRARRAGRSSSRRALLQELVRRGVADDVAQEALAGLDDDSDRELAREFVERKWPSVARLEPQAARRRLVGMLARRGYSPGLAFGVIREVEEARGMAGSLDDDQVASSLVADGFEVSAAD